MSDTVDDTTLEYQEQILDDLDDIKGSLDEESEFYDKEYQKEVLSSLKSLQKSVDSLNESTSIVLLKTFDSRTSPRASGDNIAFSSSTTAIHYNVFDVSDYENLSISLNAYSGSSKAFTCDTLYDSFSSSSVIIGSDLVEFGDNVNILSPTYDYLYVSTINSRTVSVFGTIKESSGDDPLPEEPVEVVTTSSAVIIEGLENLTQITTFQSFCSSLLIGIMLFLVFVKGLRK